MYVCLVKPTLHMLASLVVVNGDVHLGGRCDTWLSAFGVYFLKTNFDITRLDAFFALTASFR